MAETLQKTTAELMLLAKHELSPSQIESFFTNIQRLAAGEPLAYIIGRQPFHEITLKVNANVLIPRSETELLVEFVLANLSNHTIQTIADLGTGSGAIALALACARPNWQIVATDISTEALSVARENADHLQISNVYFYQGDWCAALPTQTYNAIISNPPYIARDDTALAEDVIRYEPLSAVFADDNGLADINKIIIQANPLLAANGLLMIEHGYRQANAVQALFKQNHYANIQTYPDLAGHPRFTVGEKQSSGCRSA
jgi:release factor glutamine methyltransferase